MSDLISREDAIAQVDKEFLPGVDVPICKEIRTAIKMILYNVPSADRPSWEWIPCSERMPEDGQGVIICTDDTRFKDHPVGTCIYEGGRFHTNYRYDISMIAWMPLPKPYCQNCGAKIGGNK